MTFLVSDRSAPSSNRPISSSRSNRARKAIDSSGRGAPGAGRRPSTMSNVVPGSRSLSAVAPATSSATRRLSSRPTPARRNMRSKLSPLASVATISSVGRSGAPASGSTSAVAPICRPLSAPRASGRIIWLRYSSRTASSICAGAAASSGAKLGQKASAAAVRPTKVPSPRSQRLLPISLPRSGARSSFAMRCDKRSRASVQEKAGTDTAERIWSCASAAAGWPGPPVACGRSLSSESAWDVYTSRVPSIWPPRRGSERPDP